MNPPSPTSGSRSKLLSANLSQLLSKPALKHPQQAFTVQLFNAEQQASGGNTSSSSSTSSSSAVPPRLAPGQRSAGTTTTTTKEEKDRV